MRQYCRLPYQLTDSNGQVLVKNKHLLSLKDLDLSDHLEELTDAGVTSFKIEGRLKDADCEKYYGLLQKETGCNSGEKERRKNHHKEQQLSF